MELQKKKESEKSSAKKNKLSNEFASHKKE